MTDVSTGLFIFAFNILASYVEFLSVIDTHPYFHNSLSDEEWLYAVNMEVSDTLPDLEPLL